jgi:lipopolysaccharide/colanic/teichoic acid biosynthesis glycosyltransferase
VSHGPAAWSRDGPGQPWTGRLRITTGAIPRHTKLDELPRLLDVLQPPTSLVRPEVPDLRGAVAGGQPGAHPRRPRSGITDLARVLMCHESEEPARLAILTRPS